MPSFFDSITLSGAYDGVSQTYTIPQTPNPSNSLYLIYDGVLLIDGYDFNLVGRVINFITLKPKTKDILRAYFQVNSSDPNDPQPNFYFNEVPSGSIDGNNKIFTLANAPIPSISLLLTLDGVYLTPVLDYTISNAIITFIAAPAIGSILLATYRVTYNVRLSSNIKSNLIPYIRNYLNDPNSKLWTDGELQRWISQAELEVTQRVNIYWIKFPLALVKGQGTYQMPVNLKGITRMTYRGTPVEMLTQNQIAMMSPTYRTQISKVLYAYLQFEGYYTLRLFCIPNEDLPIISTGNDIYTDKNLLNEFQISAFFYSMESAPNFIIPDYLTARTIRYYVCWKAFSIEGSGQDIKIGSYYRQKFEEQMARNIGFFSKIYAAKERQLQPQYLNIMRKVTRPVLPPNFGPIVNPY